MLTPSQAIQLANFVVWTSSRPIIEYGLSLRTWTDLSWTQVVIDGHYRMPVCFELLMKDGTSDHSLVHLPAFLYEQRFICLKQQRFGIPQDRFSPSAGPISLAHNLSALSLPLV